MKKNEIIINTADKKKKKILITLCCILSLIVVSICSYLVFSIVKTNKYNSTLRTAEKYVVIGNYEDAIVMYKEALEIDDQNEEAYVGLAKIYISMGNIDEAYNILNKGYNRIQSAKLQYMINTIDSEKKTEIEPMTKEEEEPAVLEEVKEEVEEEEVLITPEPGLYGAIEKDYTSMSDSIIQEFLQNGLISGEDPLPEYPIGQNMIHIKSVNGKTVEFDIITKDVIHQRFEAGLANVSVELDNGSAEFSFYEKYFNDQGVGTITFTDSTHFSVNLKYTNLSANHVGHVVFSEGPFTYKPLNV